MQVTVEKTGPCQAKIQFRVPGDEFHGAVRRALANAGRNVKMKGFRPGHVPPQVIERQYGKQIRQEAVEHFVRQAFEQAVKENALKVVGFQRVEVDKLTILEGADFAHQFEVGLRPEIALGEYKNLAIESELEPVLDPEVEAAIENVKQQQSHPEPAGEEGLAANGMAVAKVEWLSAAGEVVLARDGIRLSPESPTPGADAQAFEQALTGARDGDVREVAMTFPAEFDREELRGTQGTCRVTVTQAYRMIPPTDEDVRKLFQVEDEQALRRVVAEKIGEAKTERENQRIEAALIDRLLEAHAFDLPEMMVEEQTAARLSQLHKQLEGQGTPADRIREQVESQREVAREASVKGMRALFLIQAIAEAEKLLVTREDMQAEVESIAQRNQVPVEEVTEYYKKNNLLDQMAIELLERKVRKFLRENARVTEPT